MNKFFLTLGVLCFLVPVGLKFLDCRAQENVIDTYEKALEICEETEVLECLQNAKEYNEILFQLQGATAELDLNRKYELDYESQLNLAKTGVMGHIRIPKIDVELPVYHGTNEDVLANGIGHMEGTSLPVGGKNTHAVLTGHSGLPNAELFTRLDELEKKDMVFVKSCQEIMAYEVTEIRVVEPSDVSGIRICENKDLLSLITCTPFGINSHRLIVTGERVELNGKAEDIMKEIRRGAGEEINYVVIVGAVLLLFIMCRSIWRKSRNHFAGRR